MNCIRKSIYLFLFFITTSAVVFSQQIYTLNLESSIELAKEKSRSILMLQQDLKLASYDLKAVTSSFKTHVDLDLTTPQYINHIDKDPFSVDSGFVKKNRNMVNGYLRISQPLPTDGTLTLTSAVITEADFENNYRNSEVNTIIGLSQPIEAFFGYNDNRLSYKQAKLNYDLSLKRLKREELDLVYNVSRNFYFLLSYLERMNIAHMNLEKQKEAYDIAQNKFNAGLIREVEALQMEVDLGDAENKYDIAKVDYIAQKGVFKEVLGIELTDSIVINSNLEYKPVIVDVEMAVELALDNRLELKEKEIEIELTQMNIKRRKAEGRINGDIDLNYIFQGTNSRDINSSIRTTFENSWESLVAGPNGFDVRLSVNIPIIDWGENKARVRSAQASLKRSQIDLEGEKVGIERDIRTSVDRLNSSLRRLQLLEKSVIVAEKSFDISRKRFENGDIDSQAMALEHERLNNAFITRLESYIEYKLLLSDLMRKTFFDFEKNVSMIGS